MRLLMPIPQYGALLRVLQRPWSSVFVPRNQNDSNGSRNSLNMQSCPGPQANSSTYCTQLYEPSKAFYFSPFANTDADCFFISSLPSLLAALSASLAASMSFWLKKLGWLVEERSLAHILSVILTLFRVDVTLCCQNKFWGHA
jgi:hypothetical protein